MLWEYTISHPIPLSGWFWSVHCGTIAHKLYIGDWAYSTNIAIVQSTETTKAPIKGQ